MKFSAWFFLVTGVLMFGQWGFFLASGSVPEVKTAPIALAFHLAAEFTTAASLICAGAALLRRISWSRSFGLFAAGMLAYTVIVSPGYFAQQGQWPLVGMFALLFVLDIASVWNLREVKH